MGDTYKMQSLCMSDFIFELYLGRTVLCGARYEWCMISPASDV